MTKKWYYNGITHTRNMGENIFATHRRVIHKKLNRKSRDILL